MGLNILGSFGTQNMVSFCNVDPFNLDVLVYLFQMGAIMFWVSKPSFQLRSSTCRNPASVFAKNSS